MISAGLDGGGILCRGDQAGALALARIPGARHPPRTPIGTFTLPLNPEAFAALRDAGAHMDAALTDAGMRMTRRQHWVAKLKAAQKVKPVRPIPIREPYALYQHQVKAYDLALVLFDAWKEPGAGARARQER